ncbi:hypothetical protein [Bradyrhizobium elkanii]|jgi:hypothetical protein|uniref:hypothetical protein n=1 Tax=Bradyrhizobium elkanii TaxID=29448 RepID=UPI00209C9371|nr:hypothetical protein [Bradyrhizobium elkanii]MCP1975276.1 hypothetical protein [Bradyrhizobium elkanii]MCS3522392.1 hypothetical protein [Bradyrhizobium elkanii]MCS4070046.1 hypothetical protein [Bradyrhizobium elkanii]MCS4076677.1 hypothetical protein [Bradyrhizobium elkanii]MCS4112342.1 hypothetical protein [Bradyrhizobium elkanii]
MIKAKRRLRLEAAFLFARTDSCEVRFAARHVASRKALLRPSAGIVVPHVIALEVFPMRPAIRYLLIHVAIAASVLARPAVSLAEPKLEMHRAGVAADDGSGWHLAVSSKGSFSVLLPIPFNDFTTRDAQTGEVTHVVGGKSSEGIKFVAVELPPGSKPPPDLASIPKTLAANPANKVSDVRRRTSGDAEILSLTVSDGGKTMHMRCIDAKARATH